jgi:uncharacterized protein YndB with AHSA1/START domain
VTENEERVADRVVLRYERVLPHPIEDVWHAITDPDEINGWWGTRPEIDLRVDGEYVSHHATGDRVVDRIVRLEPPYLLEHTFWRHVNPDARVTYELRSVASGTLLVLTHTMTEADLRTAAEALSWQGDLYDLVARTAAGWPRLLRALDGSLRGAHHTSRSTPA